MLLLGYDVDIAVISEIHLKKKHITCLNATFRHNVVTADSLADS